MRPGWLTLRFGLGVIAAVQESIECVQCFLKPLSRALPVCTCSPLPGCSRLDKTIEKIMLNLFGSIRHPKGPKLSLSIPLLQPQLL